MTQANKKTKQNIAFFVTNGNLVCRRPEYRYEAIGKKTLLGKLGLVTPGRGWDIVGFRKVRND